MHTLTAINSNITDIIDILCLSVLVHCGMEDRVTGVRSLDRWIDAERIAINVDTLYREFSGRHGSTDTLAMFGLMAEVRRVRRGR